MKTKLIKFDEDGKILEEKQLICRYCYGEEKPEDRVFEIIINNDEEDNTTAILVSPLDLLEEIIKSMKHK